MQTGIFNRIHKGMSSLSDLSSRKDAEGIGISRINQKSLKYKTKRMNTYLDCYRSVTQQSWSRHIGLNFL